MPRKISTQEFVQMIKAGRVKPVIPMIAKKAWETWHKLPIADKHVRSIGDLIQEGINHTVSVVAPKFDCRSGVKFTTYLYKALDNYYIDVIKEVSAEKRQTHGICSLQTGIFRLGQGLAISIEDKVKLRKERTDYELAIINRVDAERKFVDVYAISSPLLRRYLIRWVLQPKAFRFKQGNDFELAQKEFRILAKQCHFSKDMCNTVQTDYICRARIADAIAKKFATPKKGETYPNQFVRSEEFAVHPILSNETIAKLIPVIA